MVIERFDSQDLIGNSPYCVLHNSYGVCLGNLDLDQLLILKLITILVTCQLDIVRNKFCPGLSWKLKVPWVTGDIF